MADMPATDAGLQYLRGFVVGLMRQAELPHRQVTVMHRDLFRRAGIPWKDGQSMDALLASLDRPQLRALMDLLREDDIEED